MHLRIVVLTGAGISAESGVPTFRDSGGIWHHVRVEEVATPEAFARDPGTVHGFYNARRRALLAGVEPNAAHLALANLERHFPEEVWVITQNIDDLHERAGTRNLIHMHGELLKARCDNCGAVVRSPLELSTGSQCPECDRVGRMRPHVVWFGEVPMGLGRIEGLLESADLFVAIGTSGQVYPAAGFVQIARARGAETLEINKAPSELGAFFDRVIHGAAAEAVPAWVDQLLGRAI